MRTWFAMVCAATDVWLAWIAPTFKVDQGYPEAGHVTKAQGTYRRSGNSCPAQPCTGPSNMTNTEKVR